MVYNVNNMVYYVFIMKQSFFEDRNDVKTLVETVKNVKISMFINNNKRMP